MQEKACVRICFGPGSGEQRHVPGVWDSLSRREKEAVIIYVKGIKLE